MDDQLRPAASGIAMRMRRAGRAVELVLESKKMKWALKVGLASGEFGGYGLSNRAARHGGDFGVLVGSLLGGHPTWPWENVAEVGLESSCRAASWGSEQLPTQKTQKGRVRPRLGHSPA